MKNLTNYQVSKVLLKEYANELKAQNLTKTDYRCYLNDYAHSLERELVRDFDKFRLQNYCCKLHPKD